MLFRYESILVLCGIGEQMEYLKDLALELDIRKRVYFVGFQKDIIEVLKIADLFIFTSKQEGLPVALMQAMACKLPVICSRLRGNVDLITHKEGGYMFHPENVEGFAKGLDHLLHCEKLCKKMGNINAERVQNYGKIAVNEIMENIYLSLGGNDE